MKWLIIIFCLASYQSNLQDDLIARHKWQLHREEIKPYLDKISVDGHSTITEPEIGEYGSLRYEFLSGNREDIEWQMEHYHLTSA